MTWECPECGFDNDDERDMCEECGAPRPAGVAPAPSTPAAPVQDLAAPSGERPAPAVYPATSSMGGTPQVQQSASQQVYQSVPVPAAQPAPAPMPQPAPVPQPMSTPQPMPAPAQQPAAMSIPQPTPMPVPQPAPVAAPQPTPAPMPQPAPQPMANAAATPAVPALTLVDPAMGEQLRLTGMTVLGRNAFPSMASNFAISRQHASVRFEQGTWLVADEGSNNGTAIMRGGQILNLAPGVSQQIHTGDVLLIPAASGEFAQLRLMVTVEEPPAVQPTQAQTAVAPRPAAVAPAAAPSTPAASPSAGVEGWFVECPECGRLHLVADERAKVGDGCEECGCSLARTSAVYRTLDPGEDYSDVR